MKRDLTFVVNKNKLKAVYHETRAIREETESLGVHVPPQRSQS